MADLWVLEVDSDTLNSQIHERTLSQNGAI